MAIRQITPTEASRELAADASAVYLDVRTPEEFEAGHPSGARNVPVVLFGGGGPRPNPEFLATVQRHLSPALKLIVGCRSGVRSQAACELLAQAGFADLANVRGGFGGSDDTPGWAESGLPVETGVVGRLD